MRRAPLLLGAVLAGGEGRRFGAPKADVTVGGVTLVRRAVDGLAEVVDDVVIVSSRPVVDASVEVVPDAMEGAGPLAGLASALDVAAARGLGGVLLLGCDLPLVDAQALAGVRDALGDHAAVAPRRAGGGIEPLCAAWSLAVRDTAFARLASPDRSLHALFRTVGGVALDAAASVEGGDGVFLNVNTPGDRDRAEAALAARKAPARR